MNKNINIAVIGLGQIGSYVLNELNTKKKDIETKTGKRIKVIAISAKNKNKNILYIVVNKTKKLINLGNHLWKLIVDNVCDFYSQNICSVLYRPCLYTIACECLHSFAIL